MESISNIDELKTLFNTTDINTISSNLKKIIQQHKMLNNPKNKKYLKQFFNLLLEYTVFHIKYDLNETLLKFNESLNDLAIMFQTETNKFFQKQISEFEILEKNEKLNLLVLTLYMTNNLNQTNQILSNLITGINKLLASLIPEDNDNLDYKVKIIRLAQILLYNIKSFNPFLVNQIEATLKVIVESDRLNTETLKVILETINDLIEIDDINIDRIYCEIINILSADKLENNSLANKIIKLYHDKSINLKARKNIQINFLTIKRKPIQELEPEIDGEKRDMTKILEDKLKKTKKQAIRNLKKEARVIDSERQQVLKKMDHKRKEEIKASNQFIEQTNIEHKKLMTSQTKKRFKLKNRK
jgi:hypothetical protein